jgi:hypothetical protein
MCHLAESSVRVLALAALDEADMRPRTGAVGPKDQEDKFCKTSSPKPRGI